MRNPELTLFSYHENFATDKEQLANCKLALRLWQERVKPESVNLEAWKCDSHACFGGHLAQWPEFQLVPQAQVCPNGRPEIKLGFHPYYFGVEADRALFGADLFQPKDLMEIRGTRNDYEIVIDRLNERIEELMPW